MLPVKMRAVCSCCGDVRPCTLYPQSVMGPTDEDFYRWAVCDSAKCQSWWAAK